MKVSVIIPAHNEQNSIKHTLHALLAQTYRDFEIIVVDNNSTDKTTDVVREFALNHEKISQKNGHKSIPIKVVHEKNKGTMWACERGRREAIGMIISRVDADCLPHQSWMADAVDIFKNNPEIVGVSGPYVYHDAKKSFRIASYIMQHWIYIPVSIFIQLPYIKRGAIAVGGNTLIRADILKKAGGFNTALTFYGDDTDTAKRTAKHGKFLWTGKLPMKTSARRFKDSGVTKITFIYLYYFFKHILS